jgi:hypothetical protein
MGKEAKMKSFLLTAAALTLSTPALAWQPEPEMDAGAGVEGSANLAMTDSKSSKFAGADLGAKIQTASAGMKMADSKTGGWDEAGIKAQMASWDSTAEGAMDWEAAKVQTAMDSAKMVDDWAATGKVEIAGVDGKAPLDDAKVMTASTKMHSGVQTAALGRKDWSDVKDAIAVAETGGKEQGVAMADASSGKVAMGGPLEEVGPITPRAPATSYPPCRPGHGDDNCIQLYERGVRTAGKIAGS